MYKTKWMAFLWINGIKNEFKRTKTEFLTVLDHAHYYIKVQGLKWEKTGLKRNTFELSWTVGWFAWNSGVKVQNPQRSAADHVAGRQGSHVACGGWLGPPLCAWTGWPSARGPRPWSTVDRLHNPEGVCNLGRWNPIGRLWKKGGGGARLSQCRPRRRHCCRHGELLGARRKHVPRHAKQKEDYYGDQRDEANTIGHK